MDSQPRQSVPARFARKEKSTISHFSIMRSTLLLVVLSLSLRQWPSLTYAKTIHTVDVDEKLVLSSHHNVDTFETETEDSTINNNEKRSLQTASCGIFTQWSDVIIFDVPFDPLRCLRDVPVDADVNILHPDIFSFVKDLQTSYLRTYNWMQGQNRKIGDYCHHCDPYVRKVTAATVQRMNRRRNSPTLAVEMKITSTCNGCAGVLASLTPFDMPSLLSMPPQATSNCACPTGTGFNLIRAPYESEFSVVFQQVIQASQNVCVKTTSPCSYGTPFQEVMNVTIEVDRPLTDQETSAAVEAFMRASNTAYTPSMINCQPEFRRFEQTHSHTLTTTRRLNEVDDSDQDRHLQSRKRMQLRMKTDGTCNQCTGKAHVSDRADNRNIMKPKIRQLQGVLHDASNCFCPLGSTVASEPIGRTTLIRLFLEELALINSPIKNVISMVDGKDASGRRERHVRRLGAKSSTVPTLRTSRALSSDTFVPPSECPMFTLNFTGISNPMWRYYSQNAILKAGDYLFDQLWWTHGVKVSGRIEEDDDRDASNLWIPKYRRGTGWVDSKSDHNVTDYRTGGAIRLFDSERPSSSSDPRYHQPLCTRTIDGIHDGEVDLGSPNEHCPGGGPGKCDCRN